MQKREWTVRLVMLGPEDQRHVKACVFHTEEAARAFMDLCMAMDEAVEAVSDADEALDNDDAA